MSMEKRGVIDADTPSEKSACCGGQCKGPSKPEMAQTKTAADHQEDHLTTRLSKAVEEKSTGKR